MLAVYMAIAAGTASAITINDIGKKLSDAESRINESGKCYVKEVTKQVWTLDGWECTKNGSYSDLLTPDGVLYMQNFSCEKLIKE